MVPSQTSHAVGGPEAVVASYRLQPPPSLLCRHRPASSRGRCCIRLHSSRRPHARSVADTVAHIHGAGRGTHAPAQPAPPHRAAALSRRVLHSAAAVSTAGGIVERPLHAACHQMPEKRWGTHTRGRTHNRLHDLCVVRRGRSMGFVGAIEHAPPPLYRRLIAEVNRRLIVGAS